MDTVASMNFHKSTRDCKELSEFTLLLFSEFTLLLFSEYVQVALTCSPVPVEILLRFNW